MDAEHENTPQNNDDASSESVVNLGEAIAISDVLELHEKLTATFSNKKEIILDGSKIEQIDGAGLQLLVSVVKQAVSNKTMFKWSGASETLCSNACQLGLAKVLHLDSKEVAS